MFKPINKRFFAPYFNGYHPCTNYHHMVEILINKDSKNIVYPINKCGSKTLTDNLTNNGFELIKVYPRVNDFDNIFLKTFLNCEGYKKLAFIRDPKERYISGLAQLIHMNPGIDIHTLCSDLTVGRIIIDGHTLPQYYNLKLENIDNIRLNDVKSMTPYIKTLCPAIEDVYSKESDYYIDLKTHASEIFHKFIDKDTFYSIFKYDYYLYDKCQETL